MLAALTGLGDAALLLPLAATIFLWLSLSGAARAAAWWTFSIVVCGGVTAVLKIFFWGCPPVADLHSPSGHTSLSTLVYGALGLIVAVDGGRWRATVAAVAASLLIVAIAVSRVLLDMHSIPEVVLGWIIGGAALAFFGRCYSRWRPARPRLAPLLVGAAVLAALLHGSELRAEELFHRLSRYLGIGCH